MRNDADSFADLVDELGRRTGLRTHVGRVDVLRQLLDRHVESHGPDADPRDAELMDALVDAAAIDESYFFRHPEQLDFLRSSVLPKLVSERDGRHTLQVWSAGCADGEEPYTLAMLLAEQGLGPRSEILGTDLSVGALARARSATYTSWSLRTAEVADRSALFEQVGRRFRLASTVTDQVAFRQHNLLDPTYPRPRTGDGFDLILCRNVLVHLQPEAVATVIPRLVAALAPGGWLLTAPADPPALGAAGAEELEVVVLPTGGLAYRLADHGGGDGGTGASAAGGSSRGRDDDGRPGPRPRAPRPGPRGREEPSRTVVPDVPGRERCRTARRLLVEDRPAEAFREAQAAAFLEPELAAAHLTLALAANAAGRPAVAARSFRRAVDLLDALPADEPVELCDGEPAGRLLELARAHALLAREAAS